MTQFKTPAEAVDYLKRMGIESHIAPFHMTEAAEALYKAVDEMIDGYYTLIQHHHEHHTEQDIAIAALTARLSQAETELAQARELLAFYADKRRYDGPNQSAEFMEGHPDKFQPSPDFPYFWDVTRDNGNIARAFLATTEPK